MRSLGPDSVPLEREGNNQGVCLFRKSCSEATLLCGTTFPSLHLTLSGRCWSFMTKALLANVGRVAHWRERASRSQIREVSTLFTLATAAVHCSGISVQACSSPDSLSLATLAFAPQEPSIFPEGAGVLQTKF